MIFNETMTGGLVISGCTKVFYFDRHPALSTHRPGDVFYYSKKARRGILYKIVIKEVRVISTRSSYGVNQVIYKDMLNSLWNESDLVTYSEAMVLVENYLAKLQAENDRLRRCQ